MPSKTSGTGPKAAVKWKQKGQPLHWELELPTVLQSEYNEQRIEVGQPKIDKATRTWFRLYHSLVWLVAATNYTKWYINDSYTGWVECPPERDDRYCLENSHRVPAWSLGTDGETGWFFEEGLSAKFENDYSQEVLEEGARQLTDPLITTGIAQKIDDQPLLQIFLAKFNNLSPEASEPNEFKPKECLKTCRRSVSRIRSSHPRTTTYIKKALDLIAQIWEEEEEIESALWVEKVNSHLTEVYGWLGSVELTPQEFVAWLKTQPQFESLFEIITSDNSEAKVEISKMMALLSINQLTFAHIYPRFIGPIDNDKISDGLEAAIKYITEGMSAPNQKAWMDLLRTTYGLVAWQLFHQTTSTVELNS
jgi:hypothetical protein